MENTIPKDQKILTWHLRTAIMIVITGLLFTFQHWSYSNIIVTVGFSLIICLYPIRFYKKTSKKIIDYVKLVLALSWSVEGILIINHLPYKMVFGYIKIVTFIIWFIMEGYKYFTGKNKIFRQASTNTFLNIALVSIIIGTMFKIQHWPGAGYMLIFGVAVLFVVLIKELWDNFK